MRHTGDRYHEASGLIHLGDSQCAMGQTGLARQSWQEALTILMDLDHPEAAEAQARLDRPDAPES